MGLKKKYIYIIFTTVNFNLQNAAHDKNLTLDKKNSGKLKRKLSTTYLNRYFIVFVISTFTIRTPVVSAVSSIN